MPAIGIFDSGIGGLTVLRALKEALPEESFVYLGDTARLPYGTKSADTIRRYLSQNIGFLLRRNIKALVIACNTASTVLTQDTWAGLPIYGVIKPGARAAVAHAGRCIGILGTRATVASGAYVQAIAALAPHVRVVQQPCPLLVPLVEEGWHDDAVTREIIARYLKEPLAQGVDTLVLGCTHYPVLKADIAALAGSGVHLVDSAQAIAELLHDDLAQGRIPAADAPRTQIWTTDAAPAFREVGERILSPFAVDEWRQADIQ